MGTLLKIGLRLGCPVSNMLGVTQKLSISALLVPSNSSLHPCHILNFTRNYAARKGTRERKEKMYRANRAKNKAKEERGEHIPPHLRKIMLKKGTTSHIESKLTDDSHKSIPEDNVWIMDMFRRPVYSFEEAVRNFQESHHPSILNMPRAHIKAWIEMDLSTKKKTAFGDAQGVILFPHLFETGPLNRVCAFCKTSEQIDAALKAGADAAVGIEGIKMFQEGKLDDEDFEFIVAHADVVGELSPIRGVLGTKYPVMKKGTVTFDVSQLIPKYKFGVQYAVKKDPLTKSFGVIELFVGQVSMDASHIENNFKALMQDILAQKPKTSTSNFVQKAMLTSEGTNETFEVNVEPYFLQDTSSGVQNQDVNDDVEPERQISSA